MAYSSARERAAQTPSTGLRHRSLEEGAGKRWSECEGSVKYSLHSSPFQSSGAVWKSRWPSWAPVPNKPTVSVDVKQHFNIPHFLESPFRSVLFQTATLGLQLQPPPHCRLPTRRWSLVEVILTAGGRRKTGTRTSALCRVVTVYIL